MGFFFLPGIDLFTKLTRLRSCFIKFGTKDVVKLAK
jgi:hypothetical protein